MNERKEKIVKFILRAFLALVFLCNAFTTGLYGVDNLATMIRYGVDRLGWGSWSSSTTVAIMGFLTPIIVLDGGVIIWSFASEIAVNKKQHDLAITMAVTSLLISATYTLSYMYYLTGGEMLPTASALMLIYTKLSMGGVFIGNGVAGLLWSSFEKVVSKPHTTNKQRLDEKQMSAFK